MKKLDKVTASKQSLEIKNIKIIPYSKTNLLSVKMDKKFKINLKFLSNKRKLDRVKSKEIE